VFCEGDKVALTFEDKKYIGRIYIVDIPFGNELPSECWERLEYSYDIYDPENNIFF